MNALRRLWATGYGRTILGAVLGAVGLGAYAYFVGCATGACPLTSNPYVATAIGALMGAVSFAPNR